MNGSPVPSFELKHASGVTVGHDDTISSQSRACSSMPDGCSAVFRPSGAIWFRKTFHTFIENDINRIHDHVISATTSIDRIQL